MHLQSMRALKRLVVGLLSLSLFGGTTLAQDKFAITYPVSNKPVDRERVTVEGKGALPGSRIQIKVLTDKWYVQTCTPTIQPNGDWSCGIVYLSGMAPFDVHTIEAQIFKDGKPGPVSTVKGVTRK